MPLKIYLPNGDESTWENEMLKCGEKADHQGERMSINDKTKSLGFPHTSYCAADTDHEGDCESRVSIDDKMKQIFPNHTQDQLFPRAPWEPYQPVDLDPKYFPENEVKPEAPKHYAKGGIETIDHIRAKLSSEEFCGYCRGNVMKYIDRYTDKGGIDDLRKLMVYAGWLVEAYEKRLIFPHKVVE